MVVPLLFIYRDTSFDDWPVVKVKGSMYLEVVLFVGGFLFLLWILTLPDERTRTLGNRIPGPFAFPIVGCVTGVPKNGVEQITVWKEQFDKHGDVWKAWVGNKLYAITRNEGDMEVILSDKQNIKKSSIYDMIYDWLGTGLLTSSGEKWHRRRKAITPAFHFKILEQFVEIFNRGAATLANKLTDYIGKPVDVHPLVSNCTLDIICETSMGINVEAQNEKSNYVSAVRKITSLYAEKIRLPWLHFDFMYAILRSNTLLKNLIKTLHQHTLKVIREKEEAMTKEKDDVVEDDTGIKKKIPLLETLLKLKNVDSTFKTDQDIREEVDTFMFEGHDTTASAITFIIHNLAQNRKVQDTLYEEVASVLRDKSEPTYEDYQEMKYLDRVIKESLRLHPSVPIVGRTITHEITLKSGFTLPVGSYLFMSFYFLHRNPKNFPNPEEFNPDNFLPEAVAKRSPFAYLPFSAGPRNCIGQKFAMMELKSVISKLILQYTFESDEAPVLQADIVLTSVNGVKIIVKKR